MNPKKWLMLASVLAAVAAIATPASASASVWKHGSEDLESFVEIGLTGGEIFETGTAGMSCKLHATLTTEGGELGEITEFKIIECPTGFEELKSCTAASAKAEGLPWTVHVNATDLTITGMHVKRTFNSGCPIKEINKTVTSTVTLVEPTAIDEIEFLGETTGYKTGGSLTVEGSAKGTYGIG